VKIPFSYIFRNLWTRKLTTLLTAGGMALVVFVFAAVLMLDAGLKKTLVSTGSFDNAILLLPPVQADHETEVDIGNGLRRNHVVRARTDVRRSHSINVQRGQVQQFE